MRNYIIFFLLVVLISLVNIPKLSAGKITDSLMINKIDKLNRMADSCLDYDILQAMILTDSAFKESIRFQYLDGWEKAISNYLGLSYQFLGESVSDNLASFAIYVIQNTENMKLACKLSMSVGRYYSYKSDFTTASKYFMKSIELSEKINSIELKSNVLHQLGWFYGLIGDDANSADSYLRALKLYKQSNDTTGLILSSQFGVESLLNSGNDYLADKLSANILNYYTQTRDSSLLAYYFKIQGRKAIRKGEYKLAYKHLDYAAEILSKIKTRKYISDIYTLSAHVAGLEMNYSKSLDYNFKALKIRNELNNERGIISSYINIGIDYYKLGKSDSALYYLRIGQKGAARTKVYRYYLRSTDWLSQTFSSLKMYDSAEYYLRLHQKYSNMINLEESARNTVKYQMKQELARKDVELLDAKLDQEQSKGLYFLIILILLVALVILIYLKFRQNKKDHEILLNQKKLLENAYQQIRVDEENLKTLNLELDNLVRVRTSHLMSEIEQRKIAENNILLSRENIIQSYENEKELNTMKSKFINMVSHEFRTPLTVISTSSEILQYHGNSEKSELISNLTHKIRNAVVQMTNLIDDIIAFNKSQSESSNLTIIEIDLSMFVDEIISEQKLTYRSVSNIELNISEKIKFIKSDKKLLRHILSNIIGNAIKYSPADGTIKISITKKYRIAEIIVEDSGIGIHEEDLSKIFEPFYRGRNIGNEAGTGFGLYLVSDYIKKLGGAINVRSALNIGTIVSLEVPHNN